jgi:hypothetical protein
VPVRLTIVADEDFEAVCQGLPQSERRTIRVRRLTREAHQQGAALTTRRRHRDWLLAWRGQPHHGGTQRAGRVPTSSGLLNGHGVIPTHKAAIIRLYLRGMLTPDIARLSYHSKEAVDRYIRGFERVRLLSSKFPKEDLPLLAGMSEGVIEEYLALLAQYHPSESRIDTIASS